MSASPAQSPAAHSAAPSQQATLDALVAVAVEQFDANLPAVAAGFGALLVDVSAPGLEAKEVYRRVKSGKLLKENGYAFVHLASNAVRQALRDEIARLLPASSVARVMPDALSLVPLEEIDTKLAFAALARPFDIAYSEVLATLAVRLGMLLGRGVLRADSHPFRPEVFLRALDAAWREFEPDPDAHGLVQGLLKPETLFDFAPLYDAVGAALMRKEGQPGSVESYRIQKTDDSAAAKAARAAGRAALAEQLRKLFGDDGGEDGVPLIPDLPDLPTGRGGWRPSGAAGFVPAPAPSQAEPAETSGSAAGTPGQTLAGGAATPGAGAAVQPGFLHPGQGAFHAQAGGAPTGPGLAPAAPGAMQPAQGVNPAPSGALHAAAGFVTAAAGQAQPAHGFAQAGAPAHAHASALEPGQAALNTMLAGLRPGVAAPLLELLAQIDPAALPVPAAAAANALGSASPAAAPGAAFAPAANVFYLPRLKQSLPQGALSRGDERTLDLLSRVFETVLLDDAIPARTRELLQLLQVPVLKAALLDKNFFFEEAHPARRLVDLLSQMGWDQRPDLLDPDADPMFQAMRRSVATASTQAAGDDGKLAGFAAAVAELEASLAFEDSALERAIAAPVASAIQQENLALATRAARDAVALRIEAAAGAGAGMADVVSGFLEQRWTTVMTFAYSIETQKPGAVGNATRAMDDLIWSVKPKATQEQRKSLITRLPRLLGTLNKWLDAIKWQDAERLQFFARLAECHASIVRAPIELSPERQLELAVEAAQQDALRQVELENAAFERARAEQQAQRAALSPLDGLERGVWLEFRNADGPRKVKLAWVSPMRTLFIFSGAGRREAFSLAADKLVEALHAGRARVLAIDGVVGQVLLEAMAQGAADPASNDAPTQTQARSSSQLL